MKDQGAARWLSRRAIRRGVVLASAAGAAALAALAVLVRDGEPAIGTLAMVSPLHLALAGAMTVGAWWLRVTRNQLLVAALGRPVGAGRMFSYFLASAFVSHVTPTSTGGVPLFVYLLTREGLSAGRAAAVAVIDSGLVAVWLLVGWPVALALGWAGMRTGWGLMVSIAGLVAGMTAFVAWVLASPKGLAGLWLRLRRAIGRSRRPWRPAVDRLLSGMVRESLRFGRALRFFVLQRPWTLAAAVVLTGLYWAFYLSIAWAVLRGLGSRVDWLALAARQLAFNAAQVFIPTPGGSGGAELLMGYLLRGLVPASRLAVAVGVWRLFTFYASLAVGGVLFVRTLKLALNGRSTEWVSTPHGAGPSPGPAGAAEPSS